MTIDVDFKLVRLGIADSIIKDWHVSARLAVCESELAATRKEIT